MVADEGEIRAIVFWGDLDRRLKTMKTQSPLAFVSKSSPMMVELEVEEVYLKEEEVVLS
jgi:hypothetical protein